jgi:hypothetical protein
MRGEFIGVWSETVREIWKPLIEQEGVPDDIFSELYRELAVAVKEPAADGAVALAINDAIQLREAFDRTLGLARIEIALARRDEVFDGSGAVGLETAIHRRAALETALTTLIGDTARSSDVLSQALSELADDPKKRAEARERAIDGIINDKLRSREAFERTGTSDFIGERALVAFLETTYGILDDMGGDPLANRYFNLLVGFIDKFSLRYDLRRPCTLRPTLTGIFASVIRGLNVLGRADGNVARRLRDFEEALQDLRLGQTEGRIGNCVAKQVMLLEAIGAASAGITGTELAGICKQITQWPHAAMRSSLLNLYGFASDFPGLRHGTPSAGMLRAIDMRDMVAMSILLAGFTPYLSDQLDADIVYRGS